MPIYPEKTANPNVKPEDYVFPGVTLDEYNDWKEKTDRYKKENKWPEPENVTIVFKDGGCTIS